MLYHSENVKDIVDEVSNKLGVQHADVLPVINYDIHDRTSMDIPTKCTKQMFVTHVGLILFAKSTIVSIAIFKR
jgi:DUF1365 family protein